MKKEHIIVGAIILFFVFAAMVFRPVSIPDDPKDCLVAEGKVTRIFEGGVNDVAFRLEGDKTMYYINRGLEYGLVLEDLQKELIGNHVTIRYPKHWTPLDPKNRVKHLCVIEYDGKEIFNEIEYFKLLKEKKKTERADS